MTTTLLVQTVLILEDHPDAARVLESVCHKTFPSVKVESTNRIKDALKLLETQRFDLALIDIGLPDGNGIEVVQSIKANSQQTKCVMTTIFDDDENLFNALRAGADGYLIKGHSPEELQQFLEDVIAGKLALSSNIAQSILNFFRTADKEAVTAEEFPEDLTSRESEILQLIAKGCQVKEVSNLLVISSNTVSHHIKNIYSKLNVHNRAEATAAAVHLNLFRPEG